MTPLKLAIKRSNFAKPGESHCSSYPHQVRRLPLWVKRRNTRKEPMWSALPPIGDIALRHFSHGSPLRQAEPETAKVGEQSWGREVPYKSSRNACSESPASFIIFFSSHRGNSPECTATTVVRRVTGCRSVTWLPFCRWNSKPARSSALIISFAETFGSRGIPTQ